MTISDVERLRRITTLPQLIAYLRDELNWPIDQDAVEDDLTFDWAPEDLGLDAETAVRIKEIKQLRPLQTGQTWGIFFVNFEKKRLPVVVLRRLLNGLVIKKRASARKSKQAAWRTRDLLFISSYGQEGKREISFAHFCEDPASSGDLPTLRVLGWDDDDTSLKLDYVVHQLKGKLSWPEDAEDAEAWRRQWTEAFVLRPREVITTARDLADELADLAKRIRRRANLVMKVESERGPLRKLHRAFREALIHDLSEDDFADMYAQTITYGLLTARVSRPAGLVSQNVADIVPITNPFLRDLLSTFLTVGGRKGKIDFDEVGISDVVRTLRDANMEAVLRDFGDRKPEEDPVIFFYEDFLKAYDPVKKVRRGVFYTPKPVVSYIVRSVNELLRAEFGLEDGLADTTTWGEMVKRHPHLSIPTITVFNEKTSREQEREIDSTLPFVQVLDPATGTGTFLVEVIDVIHHTLMARWTQEGLTETQQLAAWNDYVPRHLLPRLHGYELMMAPYAIAHMKIGLKLHETGYRFGSHERARVYLTNALEPASPFADDMAAGLFEALGHEAQEVNEVKRKRRFTVVIGNPPYAAASSNNGPWISELIAAYKEDVRGQETQIRTLSDDYVKFLRLAQWSIEAAGRGVVGMITNSGFTDGVTFRGMRGKVVGAFDYVAILDLHGHGRRGKSGVATGDDENVFDILVGTAISLFAKSLHNRVPRNVVRADVFGSRSAKYTLLGDTDCSRTSWVAITPAPPVWLFCVMDDELHREYSGWIPFLSLWGSGIEKQDRHSLYGFGIKTQQDDFAIAFERATLIARIGRLLEPKTTERALREEYRLCKTSQWSFVRARRRLPMSDWAEKIVPLLYRPFDVRFTCYTPDIVTNPRPQVMAHLLGSNIALLVSRQVGGAGWGHAYIAKHLVDNFAVSLNSKEGCHVFPLFAVLREGEEGTSQQRLAISGGGRRSNINPGRANSLAHALGLRWVEAQDSLRDGLLVPRDILDYVYGILHSPSYRQRYVEFLKTDFPLIPPIDNLELFRSLVHLGSELVALHLMESPKLDGFVTTYVGPKTPEVSRVGWSDETVWLDAAVAKKGQPAKPGTIGFRGVPEEVWNFHIGGYQVCEKWLKDRRGRKLLKADIEHYQKIVVALDETIRLMKEIDEVIERHGGWPGAFVTTGSACVGGEDVRKIAEPRPAYTPRGSRRKR